MLFFKSLEYAVSSALFPSGGYNPIIHDYHKRYTTEEIIFFHRWSYGVVLYEILTVGRFILAFNVSMAVILISLYMLRPLFCKLWKSIFLQICFFHFFILLLLLLLLYYYYYYFTVLSFQMLTIFTYALSNFF